MDSNNHNQQPGGNGIPDFTEHLSNTANRVKPMSMGKRPNFLITPEEVQNMDKKAEQKAAIPSFNQE